MRYLNRKFTFLPLQLFTLLCLSLPAFANEILITRKAPSSKALLDHKFIFMQEGSSFAKNSQPIAKSSKIHTTDKLMPSLVPAKLASAKNKSLPYASVNIQPAKDNWDDYAEEVPVELEESLDVEARIMN